MFSALKRFVGHTGEGDALARAYARLWSSPDGQTVLEHLHQHVLFRVTDPQASEAQLRFCDGQRQLVLFLCQMAAKGRKK